MSREQARARIEENPFYVLDLAPDCSRIEAERQGQKLLAMLELDLEAGKRYATPLGPCERTSDKVRAALAELRDPIRRLGHELWFVGRERVEVADNERPTGPGLKWFGARKLHGWRRR